MKKDFTVVSKSPTVFQLGSSDLSYSERIKRREKWRQCTVD